MVGILPRPNTRKFGDDPEHTREAGRKGGLSRSNKKSVSSGINISKVAKCKNCDLICPFKTKNLSDNPESNCTVPKERFYAKFIGNTQIINDKILENKFYYILGEIETIVKHSKQVLATDFHSDAQMNRYMGQLAVLSKLILDAKIHFNDKYEEIGFTKTESSITDSKNFINIVYSIINSKLDISKAQEIITEINEKTRGLIKDDEGN